MRQILQRLSVKAKPVRLHHHDKMPGKPEKTGGTAGRRRFPHWRRRGIHACDPAERRRRVPHASRIECVLIETGRRRKRWFDRRTSRKRTLILPHPRHSYAEKLSNIRQTHFVRRTVSALPGRPLLGRHSKRLGAFFPAAATGELLHPTRPYIPRNDFAQFIRNFTHTLNPFFGLRPSIFCVKQKMDGSLSRNPRVLDKPMQTRPTTAQDGVRSQQRLQR